MRALGEATFSALGVRKGDPPPSSTLLVARLSMLNRAGRPASGWLQLVDAEVVAGPAHLALALLRAERARHRGTTRLSDPGANFLCFLAGTDQFSEAVERAGVREGDQELVLVSSPSRELEPVAWELGLLPDATVYPRPPREAGLLRLGVPPEMLASVERERWELLALEQSALADLPRG